MKICTSRYIWIVIFFCLSGCNRFIPGAPAAAPTGVTVTAGDSGAVVNWTVVPGVQYFIFVDNGPNVSVTSCASSPTCVATAYVAPPYEITGLTNGTQYSVTIDGRTEEAKGGPGSTPISFTPVLAGASSTWTLGNPLGSGDLYGLTFGQIFDYPTWTYLNKYIATGANNALFSSLDGITWSPLTWNPLSPYSPPANTTFYGIANYGYYFVGVGSGGATMYNYFDGVNPLTWNYASSSVTTNDLHAVYDNGNTLIAVGNSGTIITGVVTGLPTGPYWYAPGSCGASVPTASNLKSITYSPGYYYVAVGDSGTLLTSPDACNWTQVSGIPTNVNFTSVTYGLVTSNSALTLGIQNPTLVAVASNGQVYTSTYYTNAYTTINNFGLAWTSAAMPSPASNDPTPQLTAVTFGARSTTIPVNQYAVAATSQFIAVDGAGNAFTSPDGLAWTPQPLTTGQPLNAITSGLTDYTAVGAGGLNTHSY